LTGDLIDSLASGKEGIRLNGIAPRAFVILEKMFGGSVESGST